jgi:hypothetical protein
MAHFAKLGENNEVLNTIVVNNDMLWDANGVEVEAIGIAFCHSVFGQDTRWVQTSFNGNFRKNYGYSGCTYDVQRDAFIPPKPEGDNWVLNEETCQWYDPTASEPDNGSSLDIGVSRV